MPPRRHSCSWRRLVQPLPRRPPLRNRWHRHRCRRQPLQRTRSRRAAAASTNSPLQRTTPPCKAGNTTTRSRTRRGYSRGTPSTGERPPRPVHGLCGSTTGRLRAATRPSVQSGSATLRCRVSVGHRHRPRRPTRISAVRAACSASRPSPPASILPRINCLLAVQARARCGRGVSCWVRTETRRMEMLIMLICSRSISHLVQWQHPHPAADEPAVRSIVRQQTA